MTGTLSVDPYRCLIAFAPSWSASAQQLPNHRERNGDAWPQAPGFPHRESDWYSGNISGRRRCVTGSARRQSEGAATAVRPPTLGIDVGGVLVDRVAENSDTSFFGSNPMATPMVEGSLEAVRRLLPLFECRVHIVSKAGPKIAGLSRQWLGRHGFTGTDMIPLSNVHFVRKRPDKDPVCERLGITHFIDDRLDVHRHLETVEHRYLFTGGLGCHEPPIRVDDGVMVVNSWSRLVGLLMRDLDV